MATANVDRQGIIQDEATGEVFIPASQRPDGTWRKPRRVKDGYIPQEEMPTYETKGVQWLKSRSNLPPGLNPAEVEKAKEKQVKQAAPGQPAQALSKSAKKNLKRKEKKKSQPQDEQTSKVEKVTLSMDKTSISAVSQDNSSGDANQDLIKKVRNLKKKLKQIEDLEAKVKSGELKNPEKEQLEKIAKKHTLVSEIEELENSL